MTTTATATATMPGPRPAPVGDAVIMAGRSVRAVLRTPAAVISALFVPLVLLLVMTAGFAKVVLPDGSYGDYVNRVLPLFAVMGMIFSSVTTGLAAHRDLASGMDARLRTLPVARSAPLVGRVAGDAVRNVVALLVVALVGATLGFRLRAGVPAAVGALGVGVAFGVAFAWLSVAAAVRARSAEAVASLLNMVLLVLSFLSTGFVAAADLPGWAQPIARNSPVSLTVDALRALTQGGPTTTPVLKALAWSVSLTALFATLAVRATARRSPADP